MAYMKAGWATIRTSHAVTEVVPSHDVIDHKSQIACLCKPTIETSMINGEVYWYIIHNSFDEYLDDDLCEPYKGL